MSCFIMECKALAAIANATASLLKDGFNYWGFPAEPELYEACTSCLQGTDLAKSIYQKLYAINVAAYAGRYEDHQEVLMSSAALDIDVSPYKIHEPRKIHNYHGVVFAWHYKLAKLIDCWLYQTAEYDTVNDPLRAGMQTFKNSLYNYIVMNNDIYEQAGWGIL